MTKKRIFKHYRTSKPGGQHYWIRKNYGSILNTNYGSSKISELMGKARKSEIIRLMKAGGGPITMPPERKLINEYIPYIKENRDVHIDAEERRGKIGRGLIIAKNIDVDGGFIPKQILMPGATNPIKESRDFVNILAQERRAAKEHFKKYGTFEGWQKTYEQKKNIQMV